jgi:hypothetical protein
MKFLIRAEEYAKSQGDCYWFKHLYSKNREYDSVRDAVRRTLEYLYGNDIADMLEDKKPVI